MDSHPKLKAGFLLFPGLTQLDFTGPYEVLAHVPELEIYTIAEEAGPVVRMEHNPAPPFACGHPSLANPALVTEITEDRRDLQAKRREFLALRSWKVNL